MHILSLLGNTTKVKIEILSLYITIVRECRDNFRGAQLIKPYIRRYIEICEEKLYFKPFDRS